MSQFLIKAIRGLGTGWVNLKKIVRKTNQRKFERYQAAANKSTIHEIFATRI